MRELTTSKIKQNKKLNNEVRANLHKKEEKSAGMECFIKPSPFILACKEKSHMHAIMHVHACAHTHTHTQSLSHLSLSLSLSHTHTHTHTHHPHHL